VKLWIPSEISHLLTWFCLRPSGTEPKAKFYFGVNDETLESSKEKLEVLKAAVMSKVDKIIISNDS
jgi:phosphoglucomutase